MRWKNIFNLVRKQSKPISSKLDQKLVATVRGRRLPQFKQIKYLGSFLTKTEKIIIKLALAVIVVTSSIWVFTFLNNHKTEVADKGGEYIEAVVGQPKFVNPLFSSTSDVDADLTSLIYSGLFQLDNDNKIIPELASKYTLSEDKKTYEVELKDNIKWSDGEKFTSNDVIYTFQLIQNPLVNSPLMATYQGVTVERIDEYKIKFTLKEPFTSFLSSLTLGIIPAHIWQNTQPVNIKLAKSNLQPIGTGKWKFDKLTKDNTGNIQSFSLVNNTHHYSPSPYIERLTFQFYADVNQALNVLKTQEVTSLSFLPAELKTKISAKNFNFHQFSLPQYTALFFNINNNKDLADDDLRLALAYVTDKETLKNELNGSIKIEKTPILSESLGYDKDLQDIPYSVNSSTALLEDSDWKKIQPEQYFQLEYDKLLEEKEDQFEELRTNTTTKQTASSTIEKIQKELKDAVRNKMDAKQNFYLQDDDDNILELTITTVNTDEFKKIATAIAKMWKSVGIKTQIQYISKYEINEVLKERNYQILLYGEIIGHDPDPYPFWHSSQTNYPGLNLAQFSDKRIDKILEAARSAADDNERAKQYKEFQKIFITEIPALVLYTPMHTMVVNKEVQGINIDNTFSPPDRYRNISDWYIKSKKKWLGNN